MIVLGGEDLRSNHLNRVAPSIGMSKHEKTIWA